MVEQIARKIERNDAHNDADRLSEHQLHRCLLSRFRSLRNDRAVKVFCPLDKSAEADRNVSDFGPRFGYGFAVFARQKPCQIFVRFLHQAQKLIQHFGTFEDRYFCPFFLSAYGRRDRRIQIFFVCTRDTVDHFAGRRRDYVKGLTALAVGLFSVDNHLHSCYLSLTHFSPNAVKDSIRPPQVLRPSSS